MFLFKLAMSSLFAFQGMHKVDSHLLNQLGKSSGTEALVFLDAAVDLKSYDLITDRKMKHKAMYEGMTLATKESQKEVIAILQEEGLEYKAYYITNMIWVKNINSQQIERLAKMADVRRLSANPEVKNHLPKLEIVKEAMEPISNLVHVGADRVWSELGVTGENIVIAGQDTGVQWDHPALKQQYRGTNEASVEHNYNWHDAIHSNRGSNSCGANLATPCDDNNHGTHTVGTVVGDDGNGRQIGMAPGSEWIACRNMDAGYGTPATYIECFEFFFAPYPNGGDKFTEGRTDLAPHVMNNSWGCPPSEGCTGDEFVPVLEKLKSAGMHVVTSAGNDGSRCGTIQNPPAYHSDLSFSVGAFDHAWGNIAWFSSRGPSSFDGKMGPHISAPGVNIQSAVRNSGYGSSSGTSMAGPHVVGLIALMWSANPDLIGDIEKTEEIIKATATPKTSRDNCGNTAGQVPNNTFGHGVIDAFAAVKAAQDLN